MNKYEEALKKIKSAKVALWKLINVNLNDVEKQQCIDEIIQDLNTIEKHKQIEKELGIELVTLFKALKDRKELWIKPFKDKEPINIFDKDDKDIPFIQSPQLAYIPDKFGYEWIINTSITFIYLKDYGNTWALTKEELENE